MTDEEKDKTEKEYKEWLVNDHKLLDNPTYYDIEQKCFRAFFAGTRYGLSEGRKEVREHETTCINRFHELEKENTELKAQIENLNNIIKDMESDKNELYQMYTELREKNNLLTF